MESDFASLVRLYERRIKNINLDFVRSDVDDIPWNDRMIGIKGARGVGKTTLLLQHIKRDIENTEEALYVTLDNLYFYEHNLFELAEEFMLMGGKYLFVDEVHKYPKWSVELKMIYDELPELKVVFTGSSILQMLQGQADLSRRALIYNLNGLTFREYLIFNQTLDFTTAISLDDIRNNHKEIAHTISRQIKPIAHFRKYLETGFFPFYKENETSYHQRLAQVINMVIDTDLVSIHDINIDTVHKLKQLLFVIAGSVPFKPNITKLSEHIKASRNTVLMLISYLKDAQLIAPLYASGGGDNILRKPEKIYLGNTNLIYAINAVNMNEGNERETFFMQQLSKNHEVNNAIKGDFLIDNEYLFEVGGKNKNLSQLNGETKGYVAADMMEVGHGRIIPLWLFGFLE